MTEPEQKVMKLVALDSDYHFIRSALNKRGLGYWLEKTSRGFILTFILSPQRAASMRVVFRFNSQGRLLKVHTSGRI